MNPNHTKQFAAVNGIDLHYIEFQSDNPGLLMLHGLTANAYAFNGLFEAGLPETHSIISIDQRGRGLSSKPAFAYSIHDHALDVIGLMDEKNIETINVCGHSFGGLLATYLAKHFPERFNKIIILDAAPEMNPNTPQMLAAALSRIDHRYSSFEAYIETVKQAPYISFWDDAMLAYYKADVATATDGSVEPRSNLADITLITKGVAKEPWEEHFSQMPHESMLVVALDDYTLEQPLLPTHKAKAIHKKMQRCIYKEIHGNHQTMLYGQSADHLVELIRGFV